MASKVFHIQPWSPRISLTAQNVINDVKSVAPKLEVFFMGAAALGLPGKNDIDLDILCDTKDIAVYTQKLNQVLGQPKEIKENLTAWQFEKDGFEIDIILSDPTTSHVPKQREVFEKLKSNAVLLQEYKELKENSDGLPYEEYEERKKAFFNDKVQSNSTE
jgi:hypothetical protein